MGRIVFLACLFFAVPCWGQTTWDVFAVGENITNIECSASTDFIGNANIQATNAAATEDRIYLILYSSSCISGCVAGNTVNGFLRHALTDTDNAKILIYADDGDSVPDAGDALISATLLTSGGQTEWTSVAIVDAVSCSGQYWLGFVTDASGWNYVYDNTASTMYYLTIPGSYTSPPNDLSGSWASTTRTISNYITVGP